MRPNVIRVACLLMIALLSASAQDVQPQKADVLPGSEYSGMYSFRRDGEFVQVTIEEKGRVSGFVSRFGDLESDHDEFLDQFFKEGKLEGNKIAFKTDVVHGTWYSFAGIIDRGEGKKVGDEAYYVLKGTLIETTTDDKKIESSRSRQIVMKMFPQDVSLSPAKRQ